VSAVAVGNIQNPILRFLGVMDAEINESLSTKIDLETLIETSRTGDILLFKTKGFVPSSIRRITNARVDHIGVVVIKELDNECEETCFLEASGDNGVQIHKLRERLREWWLADATVFYRRLRCVRDQKFKERTLSFLEKVNGSNYGFSITAMMLNWKDKQPALKSKFFCSELVTAFYKHLGFIHCFAKSHNYMPGDYAEKHEGARLNLVDAVLEHEVQVTKWPKMKPISTITKLSRQVSFSYLKPPQPTISFDLPLRKRSYTSGSYSKSALRVCYTDDEIFSYAADSSEKSNVYSVSASDQKKVCFCDFKAAHICIL